MDADAIIQGMSALEIEEARKELLERLPPKTVEFLRSRNAAPSQGAGLKPAPKTIPPKAETYSRKAPDIAPMVERLRFDMAGCVAEIGPEVRCKDDVATLQRDVLRYRGEGGFYSVKEACTLARSTDVNQRIFGLRFLGAVLQRCREELFRGHHQYALLRDQLGADIELGVTWVQLWQHAVYVAQVAKMVRYALDEEKPKVVAAACGAMLALIGEFTTSSMGVSYGRAPRCQMHHMQRTAASNAATGAGPNQEWVAMPIDFDSHIQAVNKEMRLEDEEANEQDIARVDPVSGLLNMQVLDRISFLLQSVKRNEALVTITARRDLIKAVHSFSLTGGDVSRAVTRTPKLMEALAAILPAYHDEPDNDAAVILDAFANLVDFVEEWGDSVIRVVSKYVSNAILCHPCHGAVARLWRALQASGYIFMTLDDLYPKICFDFNREAFLLAACSCETGNASDASILGVLSEASSRLSALDPASFYDADDESHLFVTAILQFAQCCWQQFCIEPGSPNDKEAFDVLDVGQENGRVNNGTLCEGEPGNSKIRSGIVACFRLAAGLIVRPSDDARIADCPYWSAALTTVVTTFMNLAYLVRDGDENGRDMGSEPGLNAMGRTMITCITNAAGLFAPLEDPDIIQPWDCPRLQRYVDLARLVDAVQMCAGESDLQLDTESNVKVILQLLSVLPPGADHVGLRLLSHLFGDSAKAAIQIGMELVINEEVCCGGEDEVHLDTEDLDDLRVQTLSALSASMGYELHDAAGWTSLRNVQACFVGRRAIMDGSGSVFPLRPGWEFGVAGLATHGEVTRCRGILAWILGTLESGISFCSSAAQQHVALFGRLFGSAHTDATGVATGVTDGSRGGMTVTTTDFIIQSLGKTLFERLMRSITSESRFQDAWTLPGVRAAAEALASDSFADPFFGSCFATLFCDRIVTCEWQEEILAILKDATAMQYLPKLDLVPLGGSYISQRLDTSAKGMDFRFLLGVISTNAFQKAMRSDSLVVDVVMMELVREASRRPDKPDKLKQVLSRLAGRANNERALRYLH